MPWCADGSPGGEGSDGDGILDKYCTGRDGARRIGRHGAAVSIPSVHGGAGRAGGGGAPAGGSARRGDGRDPPGDALALPGALQSAGAHRRHGGGRPVMTAAEMGRQIARGIAETGIEGAYDSVTCSTGGDRPSIGISQWEGERADALLRSITGGADFAGRPYTELAASGQLQRLRCLMGSPAGRAAQQKQLAIDCRSYAERLCGIGGLTAAAPVVYAGMWCPTSVYVVEAFLRQRVSVAERGDLDGLHRRFREDYAYAAGVPEYLAGYQNRADRIYAWVRAAGL